MSTKQFVLTTFPTVANTRDRTMAATMMAPMPPLIAIMFPLGSMSLSVSALHRLPIVPLVLDGNGNAHQVIHPTLSLGVCSGHCNSTVCLHAKAGVAATPLSCCGGLRKVPPPSRWWCWLRVGASARTTAHPPHSHSTATAQPQHSHRTVTARSQHGHSPPIPRSARG